MCRSPTSKAGTGLSVPVLRRERARASGGLFQGMAPGAKLIGIRAGNDVGLSTYAIVQAMEYTLVNQFRYNIRVCNNSYGTTLADLPYDANDPINVSTVSDARPQHHRRFRGRVMTATRPT